MSWPDGRIRTGQARGRQVWAAVLAVLSFAGLVALFAGGNALEEWLDSVDGWLPWAGTVLLLALAGLGLSVTAKPHTAWWARATPWIASALAAVALGYLAVSAWVVSFLPNT